MLWKRTFTVFAAACSLALAAQPAVASTPSRTVPKIPPGYDQQRQQAQQDLAQNQAQLAAVQREESDLEGQVRDTQTQIEQERQRAAALARMLYVQPSSLLVMAAREPTPLASLQDAIDLELVAAHAHDETQKIEKLQAHVRDLQKQREQASQREALIRQSLQVSLIQTAGIDVWGRARAWEQANPDWKVDPPNASHSKSPLGAPLSAYTLTQPYGPTIFWFEPPYSGYPHFHTGLDMSAPTGTPVQAADDGVVITAGYDGYGYGNYVVLGHPGGRATLYGHLSAISVHTGDKVSQGQAVGLVGSTGNSTGPHLHFEVLVDGLPVDPAPLITAPPGG
jgi:murein DD-endopeptidase MepM/ murein hydrolase activator NlpD